MVARSARGTQAAAETAALARAVEPGRAAQFPVSKQGAEAVIPFVPALSWAVRMSAVARREMDRYGLHTTGPNGNGSIAHLSGMHDLRRSQPWRTYLDIARGTGASAHSPRAGAGHQLLRYRQHLLRRHQRGVSGPGDARLRQP